MADGSQVGTFEDDELDFRPATRAAARPMASARTAAPDGLDFQPSAAPVRAPKAQAASQESEIDFQPAKSKPVTFGDLYAAPQARPSLSERAAILGQPSPYVRSLAPKFYDLTQIPRSPFTNEMIFGPPMATEEETRRQGILGAAPVTLGERARRALGAGAPEGSVMANITGQRGTRDNPRLFAPEQLMTEAEQARHPILTGAGEFAGGFTSPEGIMLLAGTAGAGQLAGPAAQTVKQLLAAGFTAQMLSDAAQRVPEIADAIKRGDTYAAKRLATHAVLSAATAGLAGRGMLEEQPPVFLPRGTVSSPLAMDAALERGGRRMEDFRANVAAREGMSRLAEAERGIEAARQARIDAPVDIPRAYEGPTPILGSRILGPERNPLEVAAERVREELEGRQGPGFKVLDTRRVRLGESEQPPYYEVAGPAAQSGGGTAIEPPAAGEILGARGRSKTLGELAARVLNEQDNSLLQRFGPDVLEEARHEIRAAVDMATSFERPGRYFSAVGQTDEPFIRESPKEGIRHGGSWYGVTSMRDFVAGQFPWYGEITEGPQKLAELAGSQKGAAYNRLLERVAEGIQSERESSRPIIEEFGPQLHALAGQIRDTDPELAQTMLDLAAGKAIGFHNLRAYIEEKISHAEAAAFFSNAVDEAASEAGEPAGAEEPSRLGGEARAAEGRGEETTREFAGAIDFQPLPEPLNPQEIADVTAVEHPRGLPAMRRGEFANPRGAEELRNVLASGDVERNIEAGLRGERGDEASRIREEHRSKLERGEILPGMETAVREQREAAATEQGRRLTEEFNRPPESIEEQAGRIERESPLFRGKGPQGELYSGLHPKTIIESARVLSRVWDERVARPFIDRVLKIGDKYQKAREADPAVAGGLHLLDNAPQYLRSKAAQEVHKVVGDLSRAQERLFTLMADADSRENLRANHPNEYAQAQRDPAIQAALKKYKPLEQQLTALREKMGGENLDQDYLRRVYEKHVAGVNKPSAEAKPAEYGQFDRVIRPQNVNPKSREATAEYHYQKGLHEFGPAFATKFVATHLKALRDEIAQEFLSKATLLQNGAEEPRSVTYGGQRYFRPDVAREMRDAGAKNAKEYGSYDPTQGEKFPAPAEGRYLGPKEITKTLTDYGRKEEGDPGALRRFFQEQIIGWGFGVPHIANIMRRVSQSVPGGAVNPKGWVEAWRVALGKELRDRGIASLNDPTFDMLAKHGAISTGELANLKEYWGGNLNPANWARALAQVGHRVLFEPGSASGFGGIDQRARLYIADLVRSQRPELTDSQIAEAVRTQLGDYSRANWTDRQKLLGRFMMFPGWDFSSLRWVLQHPVKTTVPPALMVMLANRALHSFGLNREEDKYDIGAIHVGDRAYSATLLRESMARNLFRPALNYAQAKIRRESDQRALDAASRGAISGAGGLLGMVRPDLSGFVALATNRQAVFSGKELISRKDLDTPGKILPSKALENVAVSTVRHALPALDRMLDSSEDIDLRSFAGGNLGLPNYRDDAEKRLIRDTAEAERVYQRVSKLAKTNPEQARQFLKDPDNATYALFYRDLAGMTKMLNRIDQAKEAVEASKISDAEKQSRLQAIEKARANLLAHADGLSKLLFQKRERAREQRPILGQPRWPILGGPERQPGAGSPLQ